MTLSLLYKKNRYFFLSYLVLVFFAIFILITYSKAHGYILMNPWHHRPLDYFFLVVTVLGDGIFIAALGILLFFLKKRFLGLMIVASYLFSGLIAQIIKNLYDSPRPRKLLDPSEYAHFIDGVTLSNYSSFPSGHSTSVFALATVLAFAARNKTYSIVFLLLAVLAGYSRIYLGQHFMEDVLAGSVIGVTSAIICELFLTTPFQKLDQRISRRRVSGNNI